MAQFQYRAKTSPTDIVQGVLEADSEAAASRLLGEMGYFPLEIRLQTDGGGVRSLIQRRRLSQRHIATLTRNLGDLLAGGLPLHRALETMREGEGSSLMRQVLSALGDEIQGGAPLSAALEKRPELFGSFYRSMVKTGEASGRLAEVLARIADFLDEEEDVSQRVRAALMYPAVVLSVGAATVLVLLTLVVPRLTAMFEDMKQVLPLPTRILVWLGDVASSYWPLIALAVIAGILYLRNISREGTVVRRLDAAKLRIPFLKDLVVQSQLARHSRTLAILLENGVPVLRSLDVAAATAGNVWLREGLASMTESVSRGERFGTAFKRTGLFPPLVTGIVSAGEEGGYLEPALRRAATLLEREAERRRRMALSLLEPALILATGLVVAFIVFAMMLPVFEIDLTLR